MQTPSQQTSQVAGKPARVSPPIVQGTSVVVVSDLALAAAMVTVGIPLRTDPPYVHITDAQGVKRCMFNFEAQSLDRTITAKECIEAWQQNITWTARNQAHPFAFAMLAVKNYLAIRDHMRDDVPFSVFDIGTADDPAARMLVKQGSKKEALARQKGFTQL